MIPEMRMNTHEGHNPRKLGWLGSWALARGESLVFGVGLALVMLVLLVAGGTAWWTFTTARTEHEKSISQRIESAASAAGTTLAPMLDRGELAQAKLVLADLAQRETLDFCRITLSNGQVLTDLDASNITLKGLPEEWGRRRPAQTGVSMTLEQGVVCAKAPMHVETRGGATLEVRKRATFGVRDAAASLKGIAVFGMTGLAGSLVLYSLLRRKMLGLAAIRESLLGAAAFDQEELPITGFRVSEHLGPEAVSWNKLLDDRQKLQGRVALEAAAQKFQNSAGTGGDFASAFDALWMGLVILDNESRIRSINGSAAVVFKKQKTEVIDRPFASVVPDPKLVEMISAITSGRSRQRAMLEVVINGERPGTDKTVLRFTVRPLRRDDSVAALVVIEDVTQQRIADESRNAFVAQATHELRTPLTNMRLYLDQLVDEGDADPRVKARCINVLSTEVRRLERIVGDMLSVAEIEAGTFKLHQDDVRLETLFNELREDFEAPAKDRDITFTMTLPPKLPVLFGDRDKIMLAVHNLIGNAVKYTPEGGSVTVKVEESAGTLVVEVIDTGFGIKDEEHELVFEKFYRSKDRRIASTAGSGIGLSLARQVIRLHGGDINVRSSIDKGSTFTLKLPVHTPIVQRAAA